MIVLLVAQTGLGARAPRTWRRPLPSRPSIYRDTGRPVMRNRYRFRVL